jgi:hypothetical protein
MFGIKKFKDAKTKKFETDKERKQFFAIQAYYQNKPKSKAYSSYKKITKK